MPRAKPDPSLTVVFRAFTPLQRKQLLWHAQNRTPIFCGTKAAATDYVEAGTGKA